ncbi:hypothetical protein AGLY_016787 [Aphis glycines]|uniref:Uncharacterized protein n=1 Tax=Aphis glycines TaxID=307491 RepID=A0A6G0SXK6_APHGL|nr:hypothetical protein AGLY_016787 [Aphis glycines]
MHETETTRLKSSSFTTTSILAKAFIEKIQFNAVAYENNICYQHFKAETKSVTMVRIFQWFLLYQSKLKKKVKTNIDGINIIIQQSWSNLENRKHMISSLTVVSHKDFDVGVKILKMLCKVPKDLKRLFKTSFYILSFIFHVFTINIIRNIDTHRVCLYIHISGDFVVVIISFNTRCSPGHKSVSLTCHFPTFLVFNFQALIITFINIVKDVAIQQRYLCASVWYRQLNKQFCEKYFTWWSIEKIPSDDNNV